MLSHNTDAVYLIALLPIDRKGVSGCQEVAFKASADGEVFTFWLEITAHSVLLVRYSYPQREDSTEAKTQWQDAR